MHAKHIFLRELSAKNLDTGLLAKKLAMAGVNITRESLDEQIAVGDFQFVLLLQLASVDRICGFER
ncbi:hypothetical protein GQA11_23575, partial [Escherichia coli]|nr:hypothetical protein [Escherichia coli]